MKMKNKIIMVVCVIILIAMAICAYLLITNKQQEKILIEEVAKISNMNVIEEDIDMEIKSKGKYAIVEKNIKSYLSEFAGYGKSVKEIVEDEKLSKVLSIDNYKEDGPEFVQTKEYITNTKTNFNDKMDKLVSMCEENTIMQNIKKEKLGNYYEELYEQLIFDDEVEENMKTIGEQLNSSRDLINEILDTEEDIIELLSNNPKTWKINANNQIEFNSTNMISQYNALVNKIMSK